MTRLTKPVKRRWQAFIVTVYPNGLLGIREFRRRKEHQVPLARCFRMACEITIEAQRKEKARLKNEARAAKGLPPVKRLVSRGLLGGGGR